MINKLLRMVDFIELESKGVITYNELNELLGEYELVNDAEIEKLLDELEKKNIKVLTVRQMKHPKSINGKKLKVYNTDIKLNSTELLLKSLDKSLSVSEDGQLNAFRELLVYKKEERELFYNSLFPLFFLFFEYKSFIPQTYDSFVRLFSSNNIIMRIKFDSIKDEFFKFLESNISKFNECYNKNSNFDALTQCLNKSGIVDSIKALNFKDYAISKLEDLYIKRFYDFKLSSIKDDVTLNLYRYCYFWFDDIKKVRNKIDLNRDYLVRSYIKLIVKIAKSYLKDGIEFNDLIQEGNKALVEAIDSIRKENLFKYKSFILKKVRKAIVSYISKNSSLISVPEKKQKVIKKITKSMDRLMQKLERNPTYSEIAEDSGVSEVIVIQLLSAMNNIRSFENTDNLDRMEYKIIKFNESEYEDNKKKESVVKDVNFRLSKYHHLLSDREEKVLRLLYGYWGISFDYGDIANILDIGSNQVKYIEKIALKKLKDKWEFFDITGYVVIV